MHILMTGATGFIGRALLQSPPPDHEITLLIRDPDRLPPGAGVNVVRTDLTQLPDPAALPESVDAVIHLAQASAAFPGGADALFQVNAAATQRLADYARRAGAKRFIFTSSGNVYAPGRGPLFEDTPLEPADFYGVTKLVSEKVLGCYREFFDVIILRLFAPYGPGQQGRMIPGIIERVRAGRTVTLTNGGEPRINPVYIDDLVEIFATALKLKGSHTVNVAGPEVVSVRDVANLAGAALGVQPVFEERESASHVNFIADTTRMNDLFGALKVTSPAQGIRRMVVSESPEGE